MSPALAPRLGLALLAASVPLLLVAWPILRFLSLSLYSMQDGQILEEPGLESFRLFWKNPSYLSTYGATLWLCLQVTLLSLAVGYPVAWWIWSSPRRLRALLLILTVLPLFMSYIVKIYTMRAILGLQGLLNQALLGLGLLEKPSMALLYNQNAVLATMTLVYMPFVILPIVLSLERIPRSLVQAAADLGAGAWTAFRTVVLPLSLPGAAAGALFTFVLALGDFVTPQMVGGTTGFTFGRLVQSQFGLAYNWPFGAALAALLLATCLALIALAGLILRRSRL